MSTMDDSRIPPEREQTLPMQEQFPGLVGSGEETPAAAILAERAAEERVEIPAPVFIP